MYFDTWSAWRANHNAEEPGGGLDGIQDWASKLGGAVPRLAGLLHLAEHAEHKSMPTVIGDEPVRAAIQIAEDHLVGHALAAFDLMAADEGIEDAKYLLRWLRSAQRMDFTKREAHKANEGRFRRVAGVEAALATLVDRGYVRKVKAKKRGPGRRSEVYEVNPASFAANIDRIDKTPPAIQLATRSVDSVDSVAVVEDAAPATSGATDGAAGGIVSPQPDGPATGRAETAGLKSGRQKDPPTTATNTPAEVGNALTPPPAWNSGVPPWEIPGTPEWHQQQAELEAACASLDD